MTRNERVRDLLAVTGRLIACMDQEIGMLRSMRPQDIQALQADKRALADAYEAHFNALRGSGGDGSEPIGDELLYDLTEATQRFQAVLADNERALNAVKEVNDRVLKAVVAAVEQDRVEAAGYTKGGKAPAPRRRGATAQPMTVNQQL